STWKSDLLWHINNALTRKLILLPFVAPCFVGIFVWNFIWHHINDFCGTVALKKTEECQKFIEKMERQKQDLANNKIFVFYCLALSTLYWFIFHFSKNLDGLEFLNLPTYFLFALPIEGVHQLATTPIHYFNQNLTPYFLR
ncbi:TPA: hypothetical protein ACQVJW_005461, partial [Serratia marcescens]